MVATSRASRPHAVTPPSDDGEVARLRGENVRLRAEVERLTAQIDAGRGTHVVVPRPLWDVIVTWPAVLGRARTATGGMIMTLREMSDLDEARRKIAEVAT